MLSIHPVALVVALAVAVALLVLPRERLLPPFFVVAIFLPLTQGFDVAGVDVSFARFLIFTVWFRFLLRGEINLGRWNPMDTALVLWCGIGAVAYFLLRAEFGALVTSMGQVVNYAGTYFLARICVRKASQVTNLTKYMRVAMVALCVVMLAEWMTGRNAFSIFGGVPAITEVRDGRLRCQGPFGHPIGAGLFSASLVPIFVGCIVARHRKRQSVMAAAFAVLAVALAASSGPVLALMAGLAAWCFWPLRWRMRLISWGIVAGLFALHLVMKAPVWALIGRVSVFDSSSSWHRLNLFDQFIQRFDEWWLVGTLSTEHWGFYAQDVANNYVRIGVSGGLFTLLAYLLLLRRGFTSIGRAIRVSQDHAERALLWGFGGALMAHVIGSFGLSYWDQNAILFALLLGLISSATGVAGSRTLARSTPPPVTVPDHGFAASPKQARE